MATGKKTVFWYTDWADAINDLSTAQKGVFLEWFMAYTAPDDIDPPLPTDADVLGVVYFVRRILKADLKKYKRQSEVNRENGKKGGRPKKTKKTHSVISKPKKGDKDKDKDKDNFLVENKPFKHPSPNSRTDAQNGYQGGQFLETLSNEVGNSEWWEAFCKAEKVLPSKREEIIAQFSLHIKAEEKTHTTYKDFKNHFKSYLRKEEVRKTHKSFYFQPSTKRSEYNF